jgi:hypothetical protein
LFFCIINFTITIFLSLFLPPSLSLLFLCKNPLFFLQTTLSAPSHALSPPCLHLPSYSFPNCHHTTLPSYTLTTHWLAYYNNSTHPQPPAIPDISTLHYNNRYTPKHTQGPQNPEAQILIPQPS